MKLSHNLGWHDHDLLTKTCINIQLCTCALYDHDQFCCTNQFNFLVHVHVQGGTFKIEGAVCMCMQARLLALCLQIKFIDQINSIRVLLSS